MLPHAGLCPLQVPITMSLLYRLGLQYNMLHSNIVGSLWSSIGVWLYETPEVRPGCPPCPLRALGCLPRCCSTVDREVCRTEQRHHGWLITDA